METIKTKSLEDLRTPFEKHQISKLPKPTKDQTEEVRNDYKKGERCNVCGGWHHPKVVHLDYVGHAALTDRLLDVDPTWSWEPVAFDDKGLPAIDKDGGLWIRLTVLGITRLGYGDAQGKTGGDAMKERIGDAMRNAAMRFGAALELWHKGILHMDGDDVQPVTKPEKSTKQKETPSKPREENAFDDLESTEFNAARLAVIEQLKSAKDVQDLTKVMNSLADKKPFIETFNQRMTELKKGN